MLEQLQKIRAIHVCSCHIVLQCKGFLCYYIAYDFYIVCQTPISLRCGGFFFRAKYLKLLWFLSPWLGSCHSLVCHYNLPQLLNNIMARSNQWVKEGGMYVNLQQVR